MSLLTALNTGTSGLQANSLELSVVGDNIANANTIGFKAGRAAFEDALLQSMIGAPGSGQIGLGAKLNAIQKIITQGALTNTGLATDLALEGNGSFVLAGNHNGVQGQYYTRAGQFTIDRDGFMTSLEGLKVQGYTADSRGVVQPALGDLQVGSLNSPAVTTNNVTFKANLDSTATVKGAAFDPLDPTNTSNFSSSVNIYDSLGNSHTIDVYWRKTGAGAWEFHAMTDGAGLTGGTAGVATEIANGTMTFDAQGRLSSQSQTSNFNPIDATNPQPLTFNLGSDTGAGGTGLDGLTQFASTSATTFTSQDGAPFGSLASIQINSKGEILGAFSNGTSRTIGAVAVAQFSSPDKLQNIGSNLAVQSVESGQPTIGQAASGGRASITGGALEQSNVDLANEFVRMIAAQRGFQANSKTVTTADELLQELMTLKR